jgi:S-adenosylmethionine synthetase
LTPEVNRRYGPAPSNADSAVNILIDVVRDQSGKKYTMDHYQTRFPTNVIDVAGFLVRLAGRNHLLSSRSCTNGPFFFFFSFSSFFVLREPERPKSAPLPPLIHYSAEEPFTKYEMCLFFARILGLPHAHIVPDAEPPPPGTAQPSCIKISLDHFLSLP